MMQLCENHSESYLQYMYLVMGQLVPRTTSTWENSHLKFETQDNSYLGQLVHWSTRT